MTSKRKSNFSKFLLLFMAIIWGFGYIGIDTALNNGWSNEGILIFRGFVGGSLCLLFSIKEKWWHNKKLFFSSILSGGILFLGYFAQTEGQKLTNIANCAFFCSLNVIMVPFFAYLFFKEKIKKQSIIATFIAVFGIFILSFNGEKFEFKIGDLLNLIGAMCFAFQIAFITSLTKYNSPFSIAGIQLYVMGLLALFLLPFNKTGHPFGTNINGLYGMLYIAIISSFIAFSVQAYAQKYVNSATSSILISQESTFATIFSVVLGKQLLTPQIIIGGTIVLSAVIITSIDWKN